MRCVLPALACVLAFGCTHEPTLAESLPADARIVVLFPEPVRGALDPRLTTRAWSGKIVHLVFEGLVSVHNGQVEPRPALAARIEQPSPGVYDIDIRPDATFHDGAPVMASDVAATYASVRNPDHGSPFRSMYARIRSVEVRGPRALRITLDGPHAPFLSDLSLGILPARLIGPDGALNGPPIGAGPYRIRARESSDEVVLERHDTYWRGRPATRYLVMRTIRDQNTRLLALLGGSADLVQNAVSPILADAMRRRSDLAVDAAPGVGYTYLGLNLRDDALRDVRVRRAIAHAIDRESLITHKFRGVARAATGMLAEGHWAYDGEVERYPHDPARARALLDAAGFPRPADGGPRLRLAYTTSTDKFRGNLARLIALQLGEVGIEVEVRAFELGTLLSDVKKGNFQMVSLQWADPSEPHFYSWIFDSAAIPTPDAPNRGGNRGAYRNVEVDALIEAGRTAADADARRAAYARLQAIVAAELPYVSLWHEDVVAVRRATLEGYQPSPNSSLFGLWRAGWRTR